LNQSGGGVAISKKVQSEKTTYLETMA